MERRIINPWAWQDQFAFVQGNEIVGPGRIVFCAGQTSVDEEGRPVHPGDMRAQVAESFDNLEAVLRDAGLGLENVVRLTYYATDVEAILEAWDIVAERLDTARSRPVSTLLGVTRLAFPELLVEIEATAVA